MNVHAINRRTFFDYEILETYEAGISLHGFEVKAVKTGHINLLGSFVTVKNQEAWLLNASIPPYQGKNTPAWYESRRSRRLLLHKKEINELLGMSSQKGLTIVPLKVYTKQGKIKIQIGIGKHKRASDKREIIKKRESEREIERTLKRG